MAMAEESKSPATPDKATHSQLVLTLTRADFTLTIGGTTQNYDEAICMLDMARRDFEAKLRAAQVRQAIEGPGRVAMPFPVRH
jgi:hypothetical protein